MTVLKSEAMTKSSAWKATAKETATQIQATATRNAPIRLRLVRVRSLS